MEILFKNLLLVRTGNNGWKMRAKMLIILFVATFLLIILRNVRPWLILFNSHLQDVDECDDYETCDGDGQECMNTFGSYRCQCEKGFAMGSNNTSPVNITCEGKVCACSWLFEIGGRGRGGGTQVKRVSI